MQPGLEQTIKILIGLNVSGHVQEIISKEIQCGATFGHALARDSPSRVMVSTHCFVDSEHAANTVMQRSQTGLLLFVNRVPVTWFSKRQTTVETSTFGCEFIAMKTAVEHIEALRYKLRMFGIPIEGPTNVFCDNEAVFKNTTIPDSTLKKKHTTICYHRAREAVAACTMWVAKEGTATNLADLFTKPLMDSRRAFLLDRFTY